MAHEQLIPSFFFPNLQSSSSSFSFLVSLLQTFPIVLPNFLEKNLRPQKSRRPVVNLCLMIENFWLAIVVVVVVCDFAAFVVLPPVFRKVFVEILIFELLFVRHVLCDFSSFCLFIPICFMCVNSNKPAPHGAVNAGSDVNAGSGHEVFGGQEKWSQYQLAAGWHRSLD